MPIPPLNNRRNQQSWRDRNKSNHNLVRRTPPLNLRNNDKKRAPERSIRGVASRINIPPIFQNFKKKIFIFLGVLFLLGSVFFVIALTWISRSLPDPNKLLEREVPQSTIIYDRTGEEVLYEIHGEEKRTLVNVSELPDYIKYATIAIEDKDFYHHSGISFWGIFRGTIWQAIRGKRVQGGSTLTQQFIKNSILTDERTIERKLKEWLLAYKVEQKFTKDEILQMYFNEIPYGSTAYGVEAASQRFFGKGAKDLNIAEAAILAALPQAPSRYSPYGQNRDLLLERQQYIISLMEEQGYISAEDAEAARSFEVEFKQKSENIKAPHFVMLVKEILSEKYGEKMVEQGGLKIYTTLDLYKQEIAEEVITERAEKNMENYDASNASLVSIDPKTGQVLVMVGSKDYFNDDIDGQVNIATSKRQPGSSLKPLVYATSFLKGYTPDTILYDVVTNFSKSKEEDSDYEPHNYNNREMGPVTIRKALAGSLNIPAVKALYLAGVGNVIDLARDLGYSTLVDKDRYGLSLVLGGGEVKLVEHVNAYSAFSREGYLNPLSYILKVEDAEGNVLEEFEKNEKKVLDPKVARMINDILSDNDARAYAFGESNWLTLKGRPVAAKTGTTNDYRDAWTLGYTPSLVTGVWVGNNDNTEMRAGAAGGVVAAPIWHDYMQKVLGDTPVENFKEPEIPKTGKAMLDGLVGDEVVVKIDKASGLLATEYTPESYIEERVYSEPHCILYYVDKNDPLGDIPENPSSDPQFELWESKVLEWVEKQHSTSTAVVTEGVPPTEKDNVHLPENIPTIKVLSPVANQTIDDSFLFSRVEATSPRGVSRVEYYINDNLFFVDDEYPFNLAKSISFLNNGYHTLKIRACDDVDNCQVEKINFNLNAENSGVLEEIEAKLLEPTGSLAVSNIDFPLQFKFSLKNSDSIAKLEVYSENEDGQKEYIDIIEPVDGDLVNVLWNEIPSTGTYKVGAEAIDWNGGSVSTKEVFIVVNNLKKTDNSTSTSATLD